MVQLCQSSDCTLSECEQPQPYNKHNKSYHTGMPKGGLFLKWIYEPHTQKIHGGKYTYTYLELQWSKTFASFLHYRLCKTKVGPDWPCTLSYWFDTRHLHISIQYQIMPILKSSDPSNASNYHPISLLLLVSNILERIIFNLDFSGAQHLLHSFTIF